MMILPDIQESKKPVPQDNTSEIPERVWKIDCNVLVNKQQVLLYFRQNKASKNLSKNLSKKKKKGSI